MKFVFSLVFMLFAGNMSASYMSDCEALIAKWKECGGESANCASIEEDITNQCKCHVKKGGSWQLVNANIMGAGDSNVCGYIPEDTTIPPPEEPPRKNYYDPNAGKGGGKGEHPGKGRN